MTSSEGAEVHEKSKEGLVKNREMQKVKKISTKWFKKLVNKNAFYIYSKHKCWLKILKLNKIGGFGDEIKT